MKKMTKRPFKTFEKSTPYLILERFTRLPELSGL